MNKNKARIINKLYRKVHWFFYSKLNVGSKINFIYPAYRHRNKKQKNADKGMLYITQIINEGAGIGHQISNFNSGVHASDVFGLKFAYPGFRDKKWEEFLGFYKDSVSLKELKKQGYKVRTLPYFNYDDKDSMNLIDKIIHSYAGCKIILNLNLDSFYRDQYGVISYIKPRFEASPSRSNDHLIYKSNELNIAVHIRRGDINKGQQTGEIGLTKRWLDMIYYENIVKQLTDELKDKDYRIYIFSEGDAEEYKVFEQYGKVTYCFDMSAIDSFLHMVRADYLVLSRSSFSYKPALLSDGVRICPPGFWHGYPDDEKWWLADEDGKYKD